MGLWYNTLIISAKRKRRQPILRFMIGASGIFTSSQICSRMICSSKQGKLFLIFSQWRFLFFYWRCPFVHLNFGQRSIWHHLLSFRYRVWTAFKELGVFARICALVSHLPIALFKDGFPLLWIFIHQIFLRHVPHLSLHDQLLIQFVHGSVGRKVSTV